MTTEAVEHETETALREPPKAPKRVFVALWLLLLVFFAVPAILSALHTARDFTGSAIDGPFQLYNALRRIAAGFRPGVDFQFFHGLGVPYAHYWLFRLLGGRFQDSELARELISTLLFPAVAILFFRGLRRTWAESLCLSCAVMAAVYLLRLPALLFALNSMVGLRSTLPVLIPVALYRVSRPRARVLVVGAMLGVALFLSTEQGIAALGAFVITAAIAVLTAADKRRRAGEAVATFAFAIVVLMLSLAAVAGGRGALGALRYNFKLVPMDQYWFFGAPPNPFIDSWSNGIRALVRTPFIGVAIFAGIAASLGFGIRMWRARGADPRATALTFLAVYGLISCGSLLGVFVPVYAQSCWRALILACLAELSFAAQSRAAGRVIGGVRMAPAVATLALSGLAIVTNPKLIAVWLIQVPGVITSPARELSFTPDAIWPATLAADDSIVAQHRRADGKPPLIWSTYSGWAEARNATFNPSVDYIIHALGPENRRAYVARFESIRPDLVQTVSPVYTPYEAWIENTNWDFYHALLDRYVVVGATPWSIFWAPRAPGNVPVQTTYATIAVPAGARTLQLPAMPAGPYPVSLVEVELQYKVHNPLQALPIIGPTPRYLVEITGALSKLPVTLDPYTESMRFPLLVRPGDRPELRLAVSSLFSPASIELTGARVASLAVDPRDVPWLRALAVRASF